ncbi:MAG TPA: hypothetical protein DDZ88_23220 [Verrucomicrobiales bacterium]|nr:hypothetical protein [Verrucomicrobiales bacterium]
MSAIMSDMKTKAAAKKSVKHRAPAAAAVRDTFTVREMNRRPQAVLTAARLLGSVTIRSRDGGDFVVTPKQTTPNKRVQEAEAFVERQRAFREKLRSMGFVPPSKEDSERIARMIAGDDP